MVIRAAIRGEAESLGDLAMRSKAHWGYDREFLARARAELTVDQRDIGHGKIWVAAQQARTVGFCALDVNARPPQLTALFVEPDRIGRGIGSALLRFALGQARDAGVSSLVIESDPNAEPFYLAHGAVRRGYRPSAATGRALPLMHIATLDR